MKFVAHRLYAGNVAENSYSGIDLILKEKPYAIETDIQLTADNIPVLMHDKLLDRTTQLHGYVSDFTYEELRRDCLLSDGRGIPTLRYLLDNLNGSGIKIYLELINPVDVPIIIDHVNSYRDSVEVILSSFHHDVLRELSEERWKTMCLFECSPLNPESFIYETGAEEVGIGFDSVSPRVIQACKTLEKPCYAWTVNNASDLQRARNLGLDGVFTDFKENE